MVLHTHFADVLHQYSLYWMHKKVCYKVTEWLMKSSELAGYKPYHDYVAATALDSIKRTNQAIDLLSDANRR
jgi:hypothetical protein